MTLMAGSKPETYQALKPKVAGAAKRSNPPR